MIFFRLILVLSLILICEFASNFPRELRTERKRRWLIFPADGTYVQLILGIGLPFEVDQQSITTGPFVKSLYYLPWNASQFRSPSIPIINDEVERKKRATSIRWNFYSSLATAAEYLGYGGKACVLRAICEAAETPFSQSADIFTELFNIIFTPSSTKEPIDKYSDYEYHAAEEFGRKHGNCGKIFSDCKINLMERFTEIFSHM